MGRAVLSIYPKKETVEGNDTYSLAVDLHDESNFHDDVVENWSRLAMIYAHSMLEEIESLVDCDLWMIDKGTQLIIENESDRLADLEEEMLPIMVSRQDELKLYVSLYYPQNSMTIGGLATPSARLGWMIGKALDTVKDQVAL